MSNTLKRRRPTTAKFVFSLEGILLILRKMQLRNQKDLEIVFKKGELAVFVRSFPNLTWWNGEKPVAVHQTNAILFAPYKYHEIKKSVLKMQNVFKYNVISPHVPTCNFLTRLYKPSFKSFDNVPCLQFIFGLWSFSFYHAIWEA